MQKIRYGIIGCGSMGREHIENIQALQATEVTAMADTHPESLAQAQALLKTPVPQFDNAPGAAGQRPLRCGGGGHTQLHPCGRAAQALRTDLHILAEKPLVHRRCRTPTHWSSRRGVARR
jgi:myo-inositol 2-dehydrogenase/D-chiro-inositol 1-dehydrogenase